MKKWVVVLVIGLGMLAFSTGIGVNGNTIKCGSEVMVPGDVCEETSAGSTVRTRTYDEMKASKENAQRTFDTWGRWALLGGGLVLAAVGVLGIVKVRGRRQEPYLGPGYLPGQAEPRQPGQPDGPYMQGMTPLPPDYPAPQQSWQPQQQYPPQQYPQQPYPPQQYPPPQQQYPPHEFGPGRPHR